MSVTAGQLSKDTELRVILMDFIHRFHTSRDRTVCSFPRKRSFSLEHIQIYDAQWQSFAVEFNHLFGLKLIHEHVCFIFAAS